MTSAPTRRSTSPTGARASITFAPAADAGRGTDEGVASPGPDALAAMPRRGPRRPRLVPARRRDEGNVAADTLTTMRDPIPGDRHEPGAGDGRARRGDARQRAHPRSAGAAHAGRAVTARDFQLVAERSSGGVARRAGLHPGRAVAVRHAGHRRAGPRARTCPTEGGEERHRRAADRSRQRTRSTPSVRAVDARRSLGTPLWSTGPATRRSASGPRSSSVARRTWARSATGSTSASMRRSTRCRPSSAPAAGRSASRCTRRRLQDHPVRAGRALRPRRPAARRRGPERGRQGVAADVFQPQTWYAGSGPLLFRTLNDGDGWEPMTSFEGADHRRIRSHPERPGLVAAVTRSTEGKARARLRLARQRRDVDLPRPYRLPDRGRRLDRARRRADAADGDRRRAVPAADRRPAPTSSRCWSTRPTRTWPSTRSPRRRRCVARSPSRSPRKASGGSTCRARAAVGHVPAHRAQRRGRPRPGRPERRAALVSVGGHRRTGRRPGRQGCFRRELLGTEDPTQGWVPYSGGWRAAGSCWALGVRGQRGTRRDAAGGRAAARRERRQPDLEAANCGQRLAAPRSGPVPAGHGRSRSTRMADGRWPAGRKGVHRVKDWNAQTQPGSPEDVEPLYENCSETEFAEEVTLPPTWLFVVQRQRDEVAADAPD